MYDFCVIGGGIVGLATAVAVLDAFPGCELVVLEKEAGVGRHQTAAHQTPERRLGRGSTGRLGQEDSNLCISESEFAKTLSLGGGIRTSASGNQIRCTRCRAKRAF